MTFVDFCEAIIERPLSEPEKVLATFIEKHPDAHIPYIIGRGSAKMSYQEKIRFLFYLYEKEKNDDKN